MIKLAKEPQTMQELLTVAKDKVVPFHGGDIIEVTILHKTRQRILVDVAGVALGIIQSREYSFDVNELSPGSKALAYVLAVENDEGYAVLSLKRADRERLWQMLDEKLRQGETVKLKVTAANRGGLMIDYAGIEGFMPVSQLAPGHYPKVEGGDSQEILNRLKSFVGQTLTAKILTVDKAANKLIFSEKAIGDEKISQLLKTIKVGQPLEGTIDGIADFGLFVKIPYQDTTVEGLVHLSEIAWDRVDDIKSLFKVGQKVKVFVIGAEKTKLSLSIKRLQADPWEIIPQKYRVGDRVKGEVTRITPFGGFVHLPEGVEALIHRSELPIDKKEDINQVLEVGKSYEFNVVTIESKSRRINLSLKKTKKRPKSQSS